ncbi:MAG: recombinase RecT [Saprospiraceae bacterium]|nr:recombinase RecT [Saprospiraceae bacterium]
MHLTKYNTKTGPIFSRIVSINGYRKIAAKTGQLISCGEPKFDYKSDDTYMTLAEIKATGKPPVSCRVTAARMIGSRVGAFTGEVLWSEFAQVDSAGQPKQKWATMPYHMLAKVAEAFALRKGFSDELSGLDIEEEEAAYIDETAAQLTAGKALEAAKDEYVDFITKCSTLEALKNVYDQNPHWHSDKTFINELGKRKAELQKQIAV